MRTTRANTLTITDMTLQTHPTNTRPTFTTCRTGVSTPETFVTIFTTNIALKSGVTIARTMPPVYPTIYTTLTVIIKIPTTRAKAITISTIGITTISTIPTNPRPTFTTYGTRVATPETFVTIFTTNIALKGRIAKTRTTPPDYPTIDTTLTVII